MLKFTANLSLLFAEVPLLERFKMAKQHGFKAVEIQFPYGISVEHLRDVLQENELKLVLFNVAADDLLQGGEGLACVPEKRPQFQRAVAQAIDYAGLLKHELVNVLPGRCLDSNRHQAYLDTFKENLVFATQAFAPLGIKTVFEAINTHDMEGFIIHSGEQMLSVLRELNQPNLFMQYDIYHAYKMGADVKQFIVEYADKIGHIQFADCPGRGQPGTGDIDFESIFAALASSSYSGWVGAEYNPVGATVDSLQWLKSG
jgi:hydroxypyruvate isomerase